jgi:ABC-type multidrug transport system fused ATPase/permease subunit
LEFLNVDYSCKANDEQNTIAATIGYFIDIAVDVDARRELLIFDAKEWLVRRYAQLSDTLLKMNEAGRLIYNRKEAPSIYRHLFPMLHNGARALLYLIVAFQPDYFGLPISQLTFLETSVEGVFSSITHLQRKLSNAFVKDMFKVRNLFECIDFKSIVPLPEQPTVYKSHPYGMKIQVEDLTFGYGENIPPVLRNINFTIEPGEMVSIVGSNGSG